MQSTTISPSQQRFKEHSSPGYGEIFKEIASSTRDLVQSEIALVTAEVKSTAFAAKNHVAQTLIFTSLLVLSVLPFIAFLIIGLGNLLEGQYWLSSLIVAVAFALIGGSFSYRAYQKLKNMDIDLSESKREFHRSMRSVHKTMDQIGDAAKGESYA